MGDTKKYYNSVKDKFKLPDFDAFHSTFEFPDLDSDEILLREFRRHIIEKIRFYVDLLEDLIHPNTTVSAYHECKFFNENEKKKIYDLYSKLMGIVRTSNMLDLEHDDTNDANFLIEINKSWPVIKTELFDLLNKLRNCWSEEDSSEISVSSYFG